MANYTDHFQKDNIRGAGIKGVENAAMAAKDRIKAREKACRSNVQCAPMAPEDWQRQEKDWRAAEKLEHRNKRGGYTFKSKHMLAD